MIKPEKPDNEAQRQRALERYRILDTPPEAAFDDLLRIATAICGTPMGSISLIDRDRQWFKSRIGLDKPETPREEAFCAHAILDPERVMVVPDAHQDPRFSGNPSVLGSPGIRFYAGAPLRSPDGMALGTLCVMNAEPQTLSPQQISGLEALARQVSQHLEMRLLSRSFHDHLNDQAQYEGEMERYQRALEAHNADLAEQTRTDPLTGLANRRAFMAAMESAIEAADRDDRNFSVAILDIDHFKIVNDVHGHAAGDRVLAEVAGYLRDCSGGHGLVARLGGEEFVWLMRDIGIREAELQCHYLCERVRSGSQALPITISVGLAHWRRGESGAGLLERADGALYAAKRGGRDRVEVSD